MRAGARGELVLTTVTKEGLPLIRYRTRDLTELDSSPCKCGRTTTRMRKCLARSDDMLIIRGVNVFPAQIERSCSKSRSLPHTISCRRARTQPRQVVSLVEVDERVFSIVSGNSNPSPIACAMRSRCLGVGIDVRLVEPEPSNAARQSQTRARQAPTHLNLGRISGVTS